MQIFKRTTSLIALALSANLAAHAVEPGCPGSSNANSDILYCDDFDDGIAISDKWNAYNNAGGNYAPFAGVGVNNTTAMRTRYDPGQVSGGAISIGLGKLPAFYLPGGGGENWKHVVSPGTKFRELYWRQYLKFEAGWSGISRKFSRLRVLTDPAPSDPGPHRAAFSGHFWQQINSNQNGASGGLYFNNARGVDDNGNVIDRGNNTGTSVWLSQTRGKTVLFKDYPQASGWYCIEAHLKLNDPGQSNGIEEFWIDGKLEARRSDQNHISTYTEYGINQVAFDNYWNGGSPQVNIVYRDNFVISTKRIGCLGDNPQPPSDTIAPAAPQALQLR